MNSRRPRPHYTPDFFTGNQNKRGYLRVGGFAARNKELPTTQIMAAKKPTPPPSDAPAPAAKKAPAKKAAAKPAAAKKAAPAKAEAPAPTEAPAKKSAPKKSAATVQPQAPQVSAAPSHDDIAKAAYLNYRSRKEQGLPGDQHGDWLAAERKLKGK